MNVSSLKIRCASFPYLCFRMQYFNFVPHCLTNPFTISTILNIKEIKMIVLSFFINYHNSTSNHFTVNNCFICNCPFLFQRIINIFFRKKLIFQQSCSSAFANPQSSLIPLYMFYMSPVNHHIMICTTSSSHYLELMDIFYHLIQVH